MKIFYYVPEIASAVGGEILRYSSRPVQSVSFDSRTVTYNSLFIPLCGVNTDGHTFLNSAIENGASCAFFNPHKNSISALPQGDYSIIAVSDPQVALGKFAAYHRNHLSATILALTGSVGKTTTKQFLQAVFSQAGKTGATPGNYNNEIGVPFTLLSMPKDIEYGIVEMGMSALHEIEYLSKITSPDVALITNIGTAHIGGLGSREKIAQAKLEILAGLSSDGLLIINGDEPLLKSTKHCITVGVENSEVDYQLQDYRITDTGSAFRIKEHGTIQEIFIPVMGQHMAINATFAYAAGRELGLSIPKILHGLQNYKGESMRQQIHCFSKIQVFEDCYNASKESMCSALTFLSQLGKKENRRTVAILGDILEAGEYSDQLHHEVGLHLIQTKIPVLFTIGKNAARISETVQKEASSVQTFHFEDQNMESFAQLITREILPNDLILLKGSRGMHLEKLLPFLKRKGERLS